VVAFTHSFFFLLPGEEVGEFFQRFSPLLSLPPIGGREESSKMKDMN